LNQRGTVGPVIAHRELVDPVYAVRGDTAYVVIFYVLTQRSSPRVV
jgi:hypothetical protein